MAATASSPSPSHASDPDAPLGVLFDLDGVLIDSHDQHRRSWFLLAEEIGKTLTLEQFNTSFGMRNETCIPDVFAWADKGDRETIDALGERKEELYRELLASDGLTALPGVLDLVEDLSVKEIPFSLASSTSRRNIEVCFAATGLDRYFGARYCGAEDVSRGKPAPDVFLEAAKTISVPPRYCVVIEDAHVGVEAALAAGARVIAVTTTHPRSSFQNSGADLVVDSLKEISALTIRNLIPRDK